VQPFRQYILKVHSRCDLDCDHCYVYKHADQSWRRRPLELDEATAVRVAERIAEHAKTHQLPEITVILHGGEPLLYGLERTRALLTLLRAEISPETRLDLRIHTNAVQLDTAFLDLFNAFEVSVGVSLDGDRAANDLHRLFATGRTSHPQVLRALELLRRPEYRDRYAGILCTIDLRNDPIAVYEALAAEQPARVDLLLPHATWDRPPLRLNGRPDEYAAWFNTVYDRWSADGRRFAIRTFDSVLGALRGEPSQTEALGLSPAAFVTIETDGTIEQADSLKTAYPGAPETGLNVLEHSLDEACAHEGITARQGGTADLCAICQACPVVEICGGGLYAHRYRSGNGFDNPSVYCEDLKGLIGHVSESAHSAQATAAGSAREVDAEPTLRRYELAAADFDALASGFGDAGTVRRAADAQTTFRRSLIAEVGQQVPAGSDAEAAWSEILKLDGARPGSVAHALMQPYTRVWAQRCLEAWAEGKAPDLTRLTEIAVSAALHAGTRLELDFELTRDVFHVPGFGTLVHGAASGRARIETDGDGATLTVHGQPHRISAAPHPDASAAWQPLRRLSAGPLDVLLDDCDPVRNCFTRPAASRLSAADFEAWVRRFEAAVAFLEEALPRHLSGLAGGFSTLTPLVPRADGAAASATNKHAYGVIGAALPADGPTLALLMIHEFQHSKLGALIDLYDLFDKSDVEARYYAPWREDPRPLEGLLQGTYAHLAITDYWRVRRHLAADAGQRAAEVRFAQVRAGVAEAIDTLLASGSLTELGERLVCTSAETLREWLSESVSEHAEAEARRAAREHRAAWDARMNARR
jgi:uncharacterized protein